MLNVRKMTILVMVISLFLTPASYASSAIASSEAHASDGQQP